LAERSPKWLPSKNIASSTCLAGCRHPVGRLSSRWPELQSVCVARLALYWLSVPALTLGRVTSGLVYAVFSARRGVAMKTPPLHPLLLLASRSEFKSSLLARPCCGRRIACGRYEPPFHGIDCLTTLESANSDLHRVYLARLCYVFRFSQPLDVSFRPHPSSLVSCR
jgi:hypothetical protein